MAQYYFITSALPPLSIGQRPLLSFKECVDMLSLNLSPTDLETVDEMLFSIDLGNIRSFWMGGPLDERGKFSAKELEEALLVKEDLPDYLIDFLDRYDSREERLRYFSALYVSFYRDRIEKSKGFLKDYFTFEREVRLVLSALRAKDFDRDLDFEMQFEDSMDSFVMEILVQKDSPGFSPPHGYKELKTLYMSTKDKPKELHKSILEYRFNRIEQMEENEHFSMNRILGYLVRLIIVESWASLNESQGLAITENLSKYG
jgi:hypothetical protein